MKALILILSFCLAIVVLFGCAGALSRNDPNNLHVYASKRLKSESLKLAVFSTWKQKYYYDQFFQETLNGILIKNGHQIIERGEIIKLLSELTLGQSGLVGDEKANPILSSSPTTSQLKEMGELLGVDGMIFFNSSLSGFASFRLVDVQNGQIIFSGTIERLKYFNKENYCLAVSHFIADAIHFVALGNSEVHGKIAFYKLRKGSLHAWRKGMFFYYNFENHLEKKINKDIK